jgi:hypothetical protein
MTVGYAMLLYLSHIADWLLNTTATSPSLIMSSIFLIKSPPVFSLCWYALLGYFASSLTHESLHFNQHSAPSYLSIS